MLEIKGFVRWFSGPKRGADRSPHAGRQGVFSIDMIETNSQAECDRRAHSGETDEIAHAKRVAFECAVERAVRGGM